MEFDVGLDADEVLVGLLGLELLGEAELDPTGVVVVRETLEARHQADDVRLGDDVLAVDEVR